MLDIFKKVSACRKPETGDWFSVTGLALHDEGVVTRLAEIPGVHLPVCMRARSRFLRSALVAVAGLAHALSIYGSVLVRAIFANRNF